MEIRWLGQSAFEIKASAGTVICDPFRALFTDDGPLKDPNTVVTFSRRDSALRGLPEEVKSLTGPGEYEISGLSIRGVATPAGDPQSSRDINTVFIVDADGVNVGVLGVPGIQPDAQAMQLVGQVDVLLVTSENGALSADDLSSVVRSFEPKVIVPSGYDPDAGAPGPELAALLTELGAKAGDPQTRLSLTRSNLPEEVTTVILQLRS
ncbi:MAG: MBL fold metallo-hydrolase [Dehalococcoidia bacterium]